MIITKEMLADIAKHVTEDPTLLKNRKENKRRYLMFSGATKEVIEGAIMKEFKKKETIEELMNRLVPLNIMQKVIGKLAGVYKEAPLRTVKSKDEKEQEMLNTIVEGLDLNMRMKEANRLFKMNKKALLEPYLDDEGVPSLRVLPAHTYEALAWKRKKKSVPNIIVKIDDTCEELIVWSDESHWVCNYKGEVIPEVMAKMDNADGENPYGELHFEYINESSSSINPIQDDDLLALSIAIPVILTDLLFGLKYQCWAILWTVGKVGDIPFNPNSVIQMDFGEEPGQTPSVNSIKPEIDADKMLTTVMALVSLLLTTKNLQSGAIADGITVQQAASGIAKVIDSSESVEDQKDQQAFFLKAERSLMKKLRNMMEYWKATNQLDKNFDFELPQDFETSIVFQEPRPIMTEAEQIETSDKKIKARLTTIKRELKKLNPDLDPTEIDALYLEIVEEQKTLAEALTKKADDGIQSKDEGKPPGSVQ